MGQRVQLKIVRREHVSGLWVDRHFCADFSAIVIELYTMVNDTRILSKAFKAASNPNRQQLFLNLMKETELNVDNEGEHSCFLAPLIKNLNVGAPTVSYHVKELVNADLIHTERRGKELVCTVNAQMLEQLKRVLSESFF